MNSLMTTMIAASCLVLSVLQVSAQKTQTDVNAVPAVAVRTAAQAEHARTVVVSLADRRLALVEDGAVKKVYRVAVGRGATPSPTGTFTIVERVANPTYYHEGKVVPPGPGNPVGTRWMGLSKKGYGIHGTNAPRSIGKAASHGCIRMAQGDLEDLFVQVRSGDTVEIVGERDEETAAIFGTPAGTPARPGMAAPAQTATAQIAPEPAPAAESTATAVTAAATVTAVVVPADR
jgi:hypothetical protein